MAKKKRKRRQFSEEYKTEVVELIRTSGKSVGQVARDLDLTETAVREWLRKAEEAEAAKDDGKDKDVRQENARLQKRVMQHSHEHYDTVDEFLSALMARTEQSHGTAQDWVFRGQPCASMELVASAFRPEVQERWRWIVAEVPFTRETDGAWSCRERDGSVARRQEEFEAQLFLHFIKAADTQGRLSLPGDTATFRQLLPFPTKFGSVASHWPSEHFLPALALAQHCGIPTRLLDWTYGPWIAAYFAASKAARSRPKSEKLAVWSLDLAASTASPFHPPTGFNPNIGAQQGLFLKTSSARFDVRPAGSDPEAMLVQTTLPANLAGELLRRLSHRRINAATLFPGPRGVVDHVREQRLWDEPPRPFDFHV